MLAVMSLEYCLTCVRGKKHEGAAQGEQACGEGRGPGVEEAVGEPRKRHQGSNAAQQRKQPKSEFRGTKNQDCGFLDRRKPGAATCA